MATFAAAVLIAAVLFADRLGPPDEIRRRIYQVGLGIGVLLLIVATATAVMPAPEGVTELGLGQPSEEGGGVLRERVSISVAGAFLALLAGLYASRRFPTLSLGAILGAVVLLITSAVGTGSGGIITYYYELTLDAGLERNAAYAAIIAVGLLMLLLYGYNEWDRWAEAPREVEAEEA